MLFSFWATKIRRTYHKAKEKKNYFTYYRAEVLSNAVRRHHYVRNVLSNAVQRDDYVRKVRPNAVQRHHLAGKILSKAVRRYHYVGKTERPACCQVRRPPISFSPGKSEAISKGNREVEVVDLVKIDSISIKQSVAVVVSPHICDAPVAADHQTVVLIVLCAYAEA